MLHCGHDPWVLTWWMALFWASLAASHKLDSWLSNPVLSSPLYIVMTLWLNNYSQGTRPGRTWGDGAASMGQPWAVPGALSHLLTYTIFQGLVQGRCSFIVRLPDSRFIRLILFILFPEGNPVTSYTSHTGLSVPGHRFYLYNRRLFSWWSGVNSR